MKVFKLLIITSLSIISLTLGLLLRGESELLDIYYFDPLNQYDDITLSFVNDDTTLSTFESEAVDLLGLSVIKFSNADFRFDEAVLKLTYTTPSETETPDLHEVILSDFTLDEAYKSQSTYAYYLRNSTFFRTPQELENHINYATFGFNKTTNSTVVSFKVTHPISDLSKVELITKDDQLPVKDIRLVGDTYFFNTDEIDYKSEYLLSIDFLEKAVKTYYVRFDRLYDEGSFTSKYNYTGTDLGAVYTESYTTFKLWAPLLQSVSLNIYAQGKFEGSYAMSESNYGVFQRRIYENLKNKEYTYSFVRNGIEYEIIDPHATYINHTNTRAVIVNTKETDPLMFRENKLTFSGQNVDALLYETSIYQMTGDSKSNGFLANTYRSLSRGNTTLSSNPEIKTGINHLVDLGITHIVFDDIFDLSYSYKAPNNSYRYLTSYPTTMSELKTLIKALNDHDIGVVFDLDIHRPKIDALEILMPGYFYEHDEGKVILNNQNATFNFKHFMAKEFIKSSLTYLTSEYNLSGLKVTPLNHFNSDDLNILLQSLKQKDPNFLMYGDFGEDAVNKANKVSPVDLRNISLIGAIDPRFNIDNFFFKEGDGDLRAYLLKEPTPDFQTYSINQAFNSLPDLTGYSTNERVQVAYMMLLAFGVPIVKAGEEFNKTGRILTYDHDEASLAFYEGYKSLVDFRKRHNSLKFDQHRDVKSKVVYKKTDSTISIQITNMDDQYPELLIVHRNHLSPKETYILPVGLDTEETRSLNDGPLDWRILFSNVTPYKSRYDSLEEISFYTNQTVLLHFGEISGNINEPPVRIPEKPHENSNAMLITMILLGLGAVIGGMLVTYFILKETKEKVA